MPVPIFAPGETLPASKLQQLNAGWVTYTPALTATTTNPTLGTGATQTGRYCLMGDIAFWFAFVKFGTSGTAAGSGIYEVSLPVAAVDTTRENVPLVCQAQIRDDSVPALYSRHVQLQTGGAKVIMKSGADPGADVTNAAPFAWAANDSIIVSGFYRTGS